MLERIPKEIDYVRYTEANKCLKGSFSIKFCHRLLEVTHQYNELKKTNKSSESFIDIEFEFGVNRFDHRFLKGSIRTSVELTCQRCMSTMTFPVDIKLSIAFILEKDKDKEDEFLGLFEPYYIVDKSEPFDLYAFIEDEILLSLPLIAKHEQACVELEKINEVVDEVFVEQDEKKENPFDILKSLKH